MEKTLLSSLPPSLRAEAARQMAAQKGGPKKSKAPKKRVERSKLEIAFEREISRYPIPQPACYPNEFTPCHDRKWRFDFAWPEIMLAVEIEGLNWQGKSRHLTPVGYTDDCEKYNWAALHGWTVLRYAGRLLPGAAREVADFVASKIKA